LERQSAMPICAFTAHEVIVIPDISLLVTTFSMQTWPLQSSATRVTSTVFLPSKSEPGWIYESRVRAKW
jgi:hypothetical protein